MTGKVVIEVENLSKFYRLGTIGGGTLREDLARWWAKTRGRPDPLLKIGEQDHGNREREHLWALRGVSFKVREGEVLGIIGRNGAGKSTLLKILSRITAPTSGRAVIRGRVGSLLEVGTGFHPELTGRENIYLNGAILGMKQTEIKQKLQEIIEFSGMGRFIDTPVKRYSSGMTVRLAFSVAAHLEPEILIVDEVLAVGDVDFQNKCISKMGEQAKSGRTVLFVSHNLSAIRRLCTTGVLMAQGSAVLHADVATVCQQYLAYKNTQTETSVVDLGEEGATGTGRLARITFKPMVDRCEAIDVASGIIIQFIYESELSEDKIHISLNVYTDEGAHVLNTFPENRSAGLGAPIPAGRTTYECTFPPFLLNAGRYRFDVYVVRGENQVAAHIESALELEVNDIPNNLAWHGKQLGIVRPKLNWRCQNAS